MNSGLARASFLLTLPLVIGGCGPTPRRSLGNLPQRQVTFDDMCHLQDYFDQRNATHLPRPFRALEEQSTETEQTEPDENGQMRRATQGEGTYIVRDSTARRELRALLSAEYDRIPADAIAPQDEEIRVHVGWWASGRVRRLRPDRDIEVRTSHGSTVFPFDPCIGEFLFGAPVYAIRRNFLDSEDARAHGRPPPPAIALPDETEIGASSAPPPSTAPGPAASVESPPASPVAPLP